MSDVLADIEQAIVHAYESGYISGHNDTVEGQWNNDTHFVAQDRAKEIVGAIKAHLSANTGAIRRTTELTYPPGTAHEKHYELPKSR